jgi:hypothetical protein
MRNMDNDEKLIKAVAAGRSQRCGALAFHAPASTFMSYMMKIAVLDPVTKTARFCTEKRSATTSKHQNTVRRVLTALHFKIEEVSKSSDMG